MNVPTPVYGRPLCYYVPSRQGATDHFVNLTDHQGNGSCTCGDFSCRVVANMKQPHELMTDATLCHHLREAHLFNLSVQLELIAAQ